MKKLEIRKQESTKKMWYSIVDLSKETDMYLILHQEVEYQPINELAKKIANKEEFVRGVSVEIFEKGVGPYDYAKCEGYDLYHLLGKKATI